VRGGPSELPSLRELLGSLAVVAVFAAALVIMATIFPGRKSDQERMTPDTQESRDHFRLVPGAEVLAKKLGLGMLRLHYEAFSDLYQIGAFGEKSPYFNSMDVDEEFVRVYERLSEPDDAGKFLRIMESARAKMASAKYDRKSPNHAFRVAAGAEFLGEMKDVCRGCSEESLLRIAVQRSDALIDSCLRR
jgi:hypothetical protein